MLQSLERELPTYSQTHQDVNVPRKRKKTCGEGRKRALPPQPPIAWEERLLLFPFLRPNIVCSFLALSSGVRGEKEKEGKSGGVTRLPVPFVLLGKKCPPPLSPSWEGERNKTDRQIGCRHTTKKKQRRAKRIVWPRGKYSWIWCIIGFRQWRHRPLLYSRNHALRSWRPLFSVRPPSVLIGQLWRKLWGRVFVKLDCHVFVYPGSNRMSSNY